jgi:hypothetical protein
MKRMQGHFIPGVLAGLVWILSPGPAIAADAADTVYTGGPILTMNDNAPMVEAVAVRHGSP